MNNKLYHHLQFVDNVYTCYVLKHHCDFGFTRYDKQLLDKKELNIPFESIRSIYTNIECTNIQYYEMFTEQNYEYIIRKEI